MSGPRNPKDSSASLSAEQPLIIKNVRRLSRVPASSGPSDALVFAAVRGFVGQFDFWYTRVMAEAVVQYHDRLCLMITLLV
jgi:hypothetical protein